MGRRLGVLVILSFVIFGCSSDSNTDPAPTVQTYLHLAVGGTDGAADDGYLLTSTDGITWANPITGTDPIFDVACAGLTCVAVGFGGSVYRSTDGTTWAVIPTSPISSGKLKAVVYDGTQFIATGVIGFDLTVYTSTDGLAWTTVTEMGGVAEPFSMAASSAVVLIATSGGVMRSTDHGATWTPASVGMTFPNLVSFNGTAFALANSAGEFFTSTDGLTWTARTNPPTPILGATAIDGQWLGVTTGGTAYITDDDGVTWNTIDTMETVNFASATSAGDLGILCGTDSGTSKGAIVTSSDGATFSRPNIGDVEDCNRVRSFAQ